jgi:hypothetical protein
MAVSLMVTALDASNNVVTRYSGTVHFASTDGQAALPANSTLMSGTGTFSVTLKTAGGQTITATDAATASITGTSNSIDVGAQGVSAGSMETPRQSRGNDIEQWQGARDGRGGKQYG